MNNDREEQKKRILAKINGSGKQVGLPTPDEETVLASIDKKQGFLQIRVLLHRKGTAVYVILATYSLIDGEWVIQRWIGIYDRELATVQNALMDGFEMASAMDEPGAERVDLPHCLCALPRKGGTKELRVTLEEYDKGKNLKLRAYQKEGDTWKWGDEWFFLFVNDLGEILPALSQAEELIRSANPSA
jgi:hypothetical protein